MVTPGVAGPEAFEKFAFGDGMQKDVLRLMAREQLFSEASVHWIEPKYFGTGAQRWMAKAQIRFFERYMMPPTKSEVLEVLRKSQVLGEVTDVLVSDISRLTGEIYDEPLSGSREFTLDSVRGFARKRAWQSAILEALPYLEMGDADRVDLIMERAKSSVYDLEAGGYWLFETVEERARRRAMDEETGGDVFPLGIPPLDLALRRGGIGPGEVVMWIAEKGGGKSIALCHTARHAVFSHGRVAIFSFEMAEEQIADRLDAGFGGVSMWSMVAEQEKMMENLRFLTGRFPRSVFIRRYPTKGATISDIKRCLDSLRRQHSWTPHVIVLDYSSIVRPSRSRERKNEELQEVVEDFRGLCVEVGAAGYTAAQLNRMGAARRVADGTHAAGSWDQLATVDYSYIINQTLEERERNMIRILIEKARDGLSKLEIGPLETEWAKMRFIAPIHAPPWEIREKYGIYFK